MSEDHAKEEEIETLENIASKADALPDFTAKEVIILRKLIRVYTGIIFIGDVGILIQKIAKYIAWAVAAWYGVKIFLGHFIVSVVKAFPK